MEGEEGRRRGRGKEREREERREREREKECWDWLLVTLCICQLIQKQEENVETWKNRMEWPSQIRDICGNLEH